MMPDLDSAEWAAVADFCLETNTTTLFEGFALVPDTLVIESEANDDPAPEADGTMERADGRTVLVYRVPADFHAEFEIEIEL